MRASIKPFATLSGYGDQGSIHLTKYIIRLNLLKFYRYLFRK